MLIVTDLSELERERPIILSIGAFDGVHRGHQYLIRQVVDRARRLDYGSAVITFDPRPQVVLRGGSKQLTGGGEKARIIGALGTDILVVLPFTRELSQLPAGQFVVTILDHLNLAEIWVGADFAFGHNREGDVDFLIRAGQSSGFAVHVVARQQFRAQSISSTAVRELVAAGDVAGAAVLLGHFLRIEGPVIAGAGRGKELGFPTANICHEAAQELPATGIYAAYLHVDGRVLPAAVSVGYNLQFGGTEVVVEAYVLDFDEDLRDKTVNLDFVERVRDEMRFESVEALVARMHEDVAVVRDILARAEEPGELILPN